MIIYNDLAHLTDDTQNAVRSFIALLKDHGLKVSVGETYRTPKRQSELFAKSQRLIAEGKSPVTKTLHSWHTTGRAADIDIIPATTDNIKFFLDTAQSLGFNTNSPDWDWHHVEFRAGRTFTSAANEYAELERSPDPKTKAGFSGLLGLASLFAAFQYFFTKRNG